MKEREQAASEKPPPPQAMSDQERLQLSERLAKAVVYTGGNTDEHLYIDTSGHIINGEGISPCKKLEIPAQPSRPVLSDPSPDPFIRSVHPTRPPDPSF